ncbi:MAG: YitT family protein [Clostridia bacterium]|nr:YitT family protein [Clostridia bacterium]
MRKRDSKNPCAVALTLFYIAAGSFLTAISFSLFFIPNDIAPGGITGVGTLLHALLGYPVGAMTALLNVPLFLAGWKRMGRGFAVKSLISMLAISAFIDLLPLEPATADPMLAAIFGGIALGAGIGFVVRGGATTGGTDMGAALIHERFPVITIGGFLLALDCLVVAVSGMVFSILSMMYAMISIFLMTKTMDRVIEGFESAKAFFIFSEFTEKIAETVLVKIDRGATFLRAQGAYSRQSRDILLCVITRLQIVQLKAIVREIDPDAFVVVTDVREAMGEGFTRA